MKMSHLPRGIIALGPAVLLAALLSSRAPAAVAFSASATSMSSIGVGAAAAPDHPSDWVLQHTPQPAVPNGSVFDVSCADAGSCVAVGRHTGSQGIWTTLAEAWNGASWVIQTTPDPSGSTYSELEGVSCATPDLCTAVGFFGLTSGKTLTLVEVWNGTSWIIAASPNPHTSRTSELSGVSCAGADACTAVGFSLSHSTGKTTVLAEVWNGKDWRIQPTPDPTGKNYLQQVSCARIGACTAVGYSLSRSGAATALAEIQSGTSWKLEVTADPLGAVYVSLAGVSCSAPVVCTAVGAYDTSSGEQLTLVEVQKGTSWSIQTSPDPSGTTAAGLSSVSCSSSDTCTAVGSYSDSSGGTLTLAETSSGSSWIIQETPNPVGSDTSYIDGVACSSAGSCIAAGYDITSAGIFAPLAEAFEEGSWSIQTIPNPRGNITSELYGTSCSSSDSCAAVGSYYIDTSGDVVTLAEVWNGSKWKIETTPNPAGSTLSELTGVSCTRTDFCTAVGYYGTESGLATLAEDWDGSTWRIEQTPDPIGATGSELSGVSCSSVDACTAVGNYVDASRDTATLTEAWNGTSWKVEASPVPPGSTRSELSGVSCPATHSCSAVGYSLDSSGIAVTLGEFWDGTAWKIQSTPNPEGAVRGSILEGVSCSAAGSCITDGYDTNSSGVNTTLVEGKHGSTWSVETTPNPAGASSSELTSVSCSASGKCTSAGFYTDSSGKTVTLAESSGGSSWKIEPTPDPAGAPVSELLAVSCAASACHGVGFRTEATGIGATLGEASG